MLNPAGVAAIPPATSSTPPDPPPPAGGHIAAALTAIAAFEAAMERTGTATRQFTTKPGNETPADTAADTRTKLAALFRYAANARREYIPGVIDEHHRHLIETQVTTLAAVALVIEGDLGPLYTWLPSWLWTPDMLTALGHITGPPPGTRPPAHP